MLSTEHWGINVVEVCGSRTSEVRRGIDAIIWGHPLSPTDAPASAMSSSRPRVDSPSAPSSGPIQPCIRSRVGAAFSGNQASYMRIFARQRKSL
jgi:hypothetical protein